MYNADRRIAGIDPARLDISPWFMGVRIVDGTACGTTATPAEFDGGLHTRCASHSTSVMVGVCAQRRLAGRDVVFGLEAESPVDPLALACGLAQGATVIA